MRTVIGTEAVLAQQLRFQRIGADLAVIRELNRTLVLDVIKAHGEASRSTIAKLTSLAKPTISAIVDGLIADGLVREAGRGVVASSGGRPPMMLQFEPTSHSVAAVHVGTRTTTVVVSDGLGGELRRHRIDTLALPAEDSLERIARAVQSTARDSDTNLERLAAVGVSIPGLTDFQRGTCVLAPNLGWRDVHVRDALGALLGLPIFVHNVSQAALVAEAVEGVAKGEADVVLLYCGAGVGAGILSQGRLLHGSGGIAGEIGHCRVPGARDRCSCGNLGCLETIAAARALSSNVRRAVAAGRKTSLAHRRLGELTPQAIGRAAEAGDDVARKAIASVGRALALGASWLANVLDPTLLVVAGGLAELGDFLLEPLRSALHEMLPARSARLDIKVSRLGQDAEVRGALFLAIQQSETYCRLVFQGRRDAVRISA
jgi:glucokinase-like ROK family protein